MRCKGKGKRPKRTWLSVTAIACTLMNLTIEPQALFDLQPNADCATYCYMHDGACLGVKHVSSDIKTAFR